MILIVQEANMPEEEFPWNEETKKKFKLDNADVEKLEGDGVVWRGDTAISLEEE